MGISAIIGLIGTVVGLVRALPQFIRLLRSKKALGVSVDTALTSSIVSFGWAIYGVMTQQPFVALATGSSGVIFFAITLAALKFGRRIHEIRISLVWLCVLSLAFLLKKEIGLGIILPVSILVSNIPQLVVTVKENDLTDLSLGTWLLSWSDGFVWGVYSLIEHDTSIMIFALFQLITSGAIVCMKLLNNRRI
nr:PQ-loop domain-containing transporter [uncultured Desulfobacter sp.]